MEKTEMSITWDKTKFDPQALRRDFPILERTFPGKKGQEIPLVYLDNAATTQKPLAVIEKIDHYYRNYNANIHRALHKLGEKATWEYEESRRKIADFIGAASPREIIYTRGTTEAINLVASSLSRKYFEEGDEILLTEMEHHSNLIPWQMVAKERGLTLRFIPFNERGELDLSNLDELLTEKTKLVAFVHMSNVFGTINPARKIIDRAHERDIPVLLDAAQSVPHMPVDVGELDCDFLCFSGHKMCGPTGIGVLYGKEKWLEEMPPYQGGGEMINAVWLDRATYADLPHKFEAGTPNIAGGIGLGAAVDYINEIGLDQIYQYEQELTNYALEKMKEIEDIRLFGQASNRGGVISFYLGNIHPHDAAQFLDHDGIAVRAGHHCAQPAMKKLEIPATTRASFYFYNTCEEVDIFVKSLEKVKEFFHGI